MSKQKDNLAELWEQHAETDLDADTHYAIAQTISLRDFWLGLIALSILLPVFISLGLWQLNKWQYKTSTQELLEQRSQDKLIVLPKYSATNRSRIESLKFRHVQVTGEYESAQQFLVDNRIYKGSAGYYVITPLRVNNSVARVLINRGWVPAARERNALPDYPAPKGKIDIQGVAVIPTTKFFDLGSTKPEGDASQLWQHLDLKAFKKQVNYPVHPIVLRLDQNIEGGFVREWPRHDERAAKNLSYALQWFGFAVASLVIWSFLWFRKNRKIGRRNRADS